MLQFMTIKELAKQYIKDYKQGNPFNSDSNRREWFMFNVIYQNELHKYFKDKSKQEYDNYFEKVFEKEKSSGQIRMF